MRFRSWIVLALLTTVLSGVEAGPSSEDGREGSAPDLPDSGVALDHASDSSRLRRVQAEPADDEETSDADRRCGEFDSHGDYVSGVAQNKPETDASDLEEGLRLGATVRIAAQTDIGKCEGPEDGSATETGGGRPSPDDERPEGPAQERGRSGEARAEHPPRDE